MHSYHLSQWVLFFFLYSGVGWVWESCYVSVLKRHWVNRGFMHGPMLPLYGSGALTVLISTIGVRDNTALIFLFGMTAATVLEYITGAVMERMFHVRYWDYSRQKLNLNGYICVSSSLCWGVFSVLLVKVVHVPVEQLVLKIPLGVSEALALVLSVAAAVDLTLSFNEAMDMKRILIQIDESRRQMHRMQEKLKTVSEELLEEYRRRSEEMLSEYRERSEELVEGYRKRSEEFVEEYKQRSVEFIENYRKRSEEFMEERTRRKNARREEYLARIEKRREARRGQLALLAERAEQLLGEELTSAIEGLLGGEDAEKRKKDLAEIKENAVRELQKMGARTDRSYLHAARQLRRNPTAVSGKFRDALEELRRNMDGRKEAENTEKQTGKETDK